MAIFQNQATLTYNGQSTNSNIAYGEILDVLSATKTAIENEYSQGEIITYVVTLRNTGNSELNSLTVTDDLGGYEFNNTTVYPLTYEDGSAVLFVDGTPQATPAVVSGPPLVISGINVPASSSAVIVYQARANSFANPTVDSAITNTVTITGDGISAPVTATETVNSSSGAELSITKSISPSQVVDNDRVTYTFVITNTGNEAVIATDNAIITDTFDPVLSNLVVTLDSVQLIQDTQYTYDETTGLFETNTGVITVPAATYTQNPQTGEYTLVPGITTLVITGTI